MTSLWSQAPGQLVESTVAVLCWLPQLLDLKEVKAGDFLAMLKIISF